MYVHLNNTTAVFYLANNEPKEGEIAVMKLKSVLIAFALLFFVFFINGCCTQDSDCQDGEYCNGVERCGDPASIANICYRGTPPCPREQCDEDTDSCEEAVEKLTILYDYAEIPTMNTYTVYGQAKNTSGEQLSYAEIKIRMLDGDGEVFYEDTVSIDGLNPDEVWNFDVTYTGRLPAEQSYEFSVVEAY